MASETSAEGVWPEPVSAAEQPATTGTSGVWDGYFGRPAPPEGGVNWDTYSHEELYQMLWQDADVADVSTIAAEWSEHRSALVNHAEVLREQRVALLEGWQGTGAEQAARRLDLLADRVEKIAELAHAGERAAEQAADALARARATMPAPPGEAAAPMTDAATNWADLTAATPASRPAPSTPTADTGNAFDAVGGAGFSFYVGANATDMHKQQAVRSMRTYESSLTDSSHLIGQAQGTIPAAAATPSGTTEPAGGAAGGTRSWRDLVGSGGGGGAATGPSAGATAGALVGAGRVVTGMGQAAGMGPVAGMGPANPLAQGMRAGAMPIQGGPGGAAAQVAAESAAARTGALGGTVPPGAGARGGSEGEEHENHLPTIDHELFPLAEPGSEAVIGLPPEARR
ncbi:hypothetical protein [Amycolatopsis cihanbeyliensis]|uniref:PPE family protein n=1 Tax=Amycolatopsis cihanbeyliensis TaxID=1128664 RepID=A0A542DD51_AMYCI|nr:hypothetical protein [Amycolatopsis cihanbeyliensis]TQJ00993.1 hypothetical protein FB471_0653 [Amycolatopsis cihanbeyliensis]